MAMIWFILRDEDDVWLLLQLCQRRDAWLRPLLGYGEEAAKYSGWPGQPRIDEYGKGPWKEAGRGKGRDGRAKGEQESGVTVERLDREGHFLPQADSGGETDMQAAIMIIDDVDAGRGGISGRHGGSR